VGQLGQVQGRPEGDGPVGGFQGPRQHQDAHWLKLQQGVVGTDTLSLRGRESPLPALIPMATRRALTIARRLEAKLAPPVNRLG
jgi:hypothetical protein